MNKIGWIALGGVALAVGVGAGAAIAERGPGWRDGHRGPHGWHHRGDRGERGERHHGRWGRWSRREMTKADMEERARSRFARFDANSDGVIDRAEIEAQFTQNAGRRGRRNRMMGGIQRRIMRMDADRDGKVTKAEFIKRIEDGFKRADLTGDGQITDLDLPPFMRGRDVLSGKAGRGPGRGMHRGHRRGMRMFRLLRGANTNGDNVVTKDEVMAAVEKRFALMDRNGDGVLDTADREAMRKEMIAYRVDRFLHRFDARATGKVTREAFMAKAAERFAERDVNGDGKINREDRGDRGRRWNRRGGPGHGPGPMRDQDAGPQDGRRL